MPPVSLHDTSPPARRVWRAGTLTYTAGGLAVLFCWLLWGDFAWSMRERSVGPMMQLLLKKYEASDLLVGLLFGTLPNALGLVLGPIISYRSDRHRGRWGRRIPFLAIPTPFAVVAMIGLAFSPQLGTWFHGSFGSLSPGLNPSVLLFFGLFWALFEVAAVVVGSVYNGLINDVVPVTHLGRFYGLFRALSLIAGMIFNFWMLAKAEAHYMGIFIGVGLLYGIGFLVMCLRVREGEYPPVTPVTEVEPARGFVAATRIYFRECFSRPYYLWVFGSITLPMLAFAPVYMFGVFFAKSVQMDMGTYGKYIALTYLISLVLAYPLGAIADRFHPLRLGLAALGLHAVITLWAGFYARDAGTFAFALVAQSVVAGIWSTGTASLGQRLYPTEKFAQFASAQGILASIGTLVLAPVVGALLDVSGHAYRYTYLLSFGLTLISLVLLVGLYRRFITLGGQQTYTPPL